MVSDRAPGSGTTLCGAISEKIGDRDQGLPKVSGASRPVDFDGNPPCLIAAEHLGRSALPPNALQTECGDGDGGDV